MVNLGCEVKANAADMGLHVASAATVHLDLAMKQIVALRHTIKTHEDTITRMATQLGATVTFPRPGLMIMSGSA